MQARNDTLAPAFSFFPSLKPPHRTVFFYRSLVLILTFLAYASFHASRKPSSIVKSVLGPNLASLAPDIGSDGLNRTSEEAEAGWAPFNGHGGTYRLGEVDLAFLSSYSAGMYLAGHVADRIDLRLFLVSGMMGSGVLTIIFGLGYWFDVHNLVYFVVVQVACGLFQSIGWPCVVSVVGNWFAKEKRGLIMGVWNSHTSVGNIVGAVIAAGVLEFGWGWSFVLPGILIISVSFLVFLFLVPTPEDLGLDPPGEKLVTNVQDKDDADNSRDEEIEEEGLLETRRSDSVAAVGFLEAWRLPGVAPFAFCLFFSKLVAYTFLYWLPFYIRHAAVAGVHLSHKTAGNLSTLFDVGGVTGGILAGYISDKIDARAVTSIIFLLLSAPVLILYRLYGSISMFTNIVLMFLSGLLVNGPYALITTAVAADLGTQDLVKGNSRALATITAIIDGTGSVGAAVGPLLAGYFSSRSWNGVFTMLIISVICASFLLIRIASMELREKRFTVQQTDENCWSRAST